MKDKLYVIYLVVAIFSALATTGNFLLNAGFLQGTGLGFGDGFTTIGSSQEITDAQPITTYYDGRETHKVLNSKFWKADMQGIYQTSTDQNLDIEGKFATATFNEPINNRNIKFEVEYLSQATSTETASVSITVGDIYWQTKDGTAKTAFETVSNPFTNITRVLIGGVERGRFDRSQAPTYVVVDSSHTRLTLTGLRYQPILGCENDATDAIVEQTFTGGQAINLDSFRFPIKQFCYSNPIIVIRGDQSGVTFDGSIDVFSRLAQAQTVSIPEGDVWTVRYVIDNTKGLVATACGSGNAYDVEKQSCTPLVLALSEGTIDTDTNTFTIEPKVVCEEKLGVKGIWNEQEQRCIVEQSVMEYCDVFTDECSLRISTVCTNAGLTYNKELQRCESESTIEQGVVEQPVSTGFTWVTWTLLGTTIFFALLSGIIFMTRKRR